jgi:hypothetical protein
MNDSELETQLRALHPSTPSTGLAARIGRELEALPRLCPTAGVVPRSPRTALGLHWLRNLGWAGAGAAAMLAGVLSFPPAEKTAAHPVSAPSVAEEQAYEPAGASRELLSVKDSDDLIETEDGPVREVRYTYLERLAWAHPATGARLEIELPREDVYLLPVSLQ